MKKHKYDIHDKKEIIKSEILRIDRTLGKTPTQKDYKNYSKINISLGQVTYLFGSWSETIKYSGLKPNPFQKPPSSEIPEKNLVDEFIFVANQIKKIPGSHLFRSKSKYSYKPYTNRWGSWLKAVNYITQKYKNNFTFPVQRKLNNKRNKIPKKLRYVCPLQYEPRNEMETIALFSYLCNELGYEIKRIQAEFPDAILQKNGRDILVEFEFLSSNYKEHCHPDNEKYLCICWRKDLELKKTPVFSLEEYIRNRNT
ncbi:MAG: hypothetical protein PHV17_04520 [Candidatus Omnitrophica bacterium]|nr:hypothetical protein [Candidatus Omnitrophota bacterium]